MNNLNGNRKNEFRRKQEEKQRKLALKIEDEAGELREGSLKSEEAIPSLDELCAMGERVEQQTTFSAKEAIRNKIKARRDAERYKTTSTDSEKWTPNPFEDSNACICFGFNGDGWSPYGAVAYGGSALFIDGVGENGKMNSGYGDIKISGKDMTKLLSYLDSDYNPTITIRAAQ